MTINHLLLVGSIVVAAGCSSKESGSLSETAEENTAGGASASAEAVPPNANEKTAAPVTAEHPDLVQICASATKKLSEGIGQDTRLLQWGNALVLKDPQVKKYFEAIEGSSLQHRYELVQQIAKEAGHSDWHCPDLQALYALADQE